MNGLVSGYGSDSDDDEVTSDTKKSKDEDWMECMDNTTGYPYFWNRKTNEVRWDRPDGIPAQATKVPEKKEDNKPKKKTRSKSPPQVFIGPTLPQLTPEEIARQKVIKFEESMSKDIEKEILKEEPIDWVKNKPQRGLYSKPFSWKKNSTCLQTYRDIETSFKKASQSISLIAGSYGDEDDTDEDSPPKKKRVTSVQVKVQKAKQPKPLLKDIPGIFKSDEQEDSENKDQPKKKRRWDMKDRTFINSSAEKLCLKLEALEVAKIAISPLKLLAVQVETLFAAWHNGALSNSYLTSTMEKMSAQMQDIESHHLAPPGWRAVWDRSTKKYAYENLITRETQFDKPEEDEDDDEEEEQDVKKSDETKTESNSKNQENPPLPPEEKEKNPPLPPPPPEISLPPLPASQNQVEDMDLSEDETEIPPIETPKEPPTKDAADPLSNALSSFYSDIAGIDGSSQETTPVPTPPKVNSPSPSLGRESPGLSDERSNSPFCGDSQDESKKRKATKISSGLALKKKNVGSLVAKWQNIQQEVKRNQ